ncbi:hypothetical protein [Streptomyces lanatus]|uniref:Uncharacterized protein n=1 Tax=Streptomyces lanatus TaxID=66900 RepID=A0ABV1Y5J2_9ACTN|nr:hypothetical protein [Streptomyces lanatus]
MVAFRAGVFGLVFGGARLTFHLLDLLETPLDIRSAVNPRRLLAVNRRAVTTQLLVGAPVFGVVVGVGGEIVVALLEGPLGPIVWLRAAGLVSGIACALAYALAVTAWGQWLVFARIWLPLTGRLPWDVMTFLDDAYRRGAAPGRSGLPVPPRPPTTPPRPGPPEPLRGSGAAPRTAWASSSRCWELTEQSSQNSSLSNWCEAQGH